jgi:anaerobic selenocysteine-containing dehydrogenase
MAGPHLRTCCLCEALCGVVIEADDGRVRSIRGDPDDVFSRGHICPKAVALQDLHDDPDRLRRPMRRRRKAPGTTGRSWPASPGGCTSRRRRRSPNG